MVSKKSVAPTKSAPSKSKSSFMDEALKARSKPKGGTVNPAGKSVPGVGAAKAKMAADSARSERNMARRNATGFNSPTKGTKGKRAFVPKTQVTRRRTD